MAVQRIVTNLQCSSLEQTVQFYTNVLGMKVVMDHGWIVTLADSEQPHIQLSFMTHDQTASVMPIASIQVDDVEASYRAAIAAGAEIVHELTDESWGVRRFFLRDQSGNVVNILSHNR